MTSAFSDLQDQMYSAFNLADIEDLCFRLNIDYDELSGTAKRDKIRELILLSARLDRIDDLVNQCNSLRPGIFWPTPFDLKEELDPATLLGAAISANLRGRVGESHRLLSMVKAIDPDYPELGTLLREVSDELSSEYVGKGELVVAKKVLRDSSPTKKTDRFPWASVRPIYRQPVLWFIIVGICAISTIAGGAVGYITSEGGLPELLPTVTRTVLPTVSSTPPPTATFTDTLTPSSTPKPKNTPTIQSTKTPSLFPQVNLDELVVFNDPPRVDVTFSTQDIPAEYKPMVIVEDWFGNRFGWTHIESKGKNTYSLTGITLGTSDTDCGKPFKLYMTMTPDERVPGQIDRLPSGYKTELSVILQCPL